MDFLVDTIGFLSFKHDLRCQTHTASWREMILPYSAQRQPAFSVTELLSKHKYVLFTLCKSSWGFLACINKKQRRKKNLLVFRSPWVFPRVYIYIYMYFYSHLQVSVYYCSVMCKRAAHIALSLLIPL